MNKKHVKGTALIEFVFIFGVVAFGGFAAVEFSRVFSVSKSLANLSRDAANTAKRSCANRTGTQLQACLQTTNNQLVRAAEVMLPGFSSHGTIRLMIWKNPDLVLTSLPAPTTATTGNAAPTRYDNMAADPDFMNIFKNTRNVVVSEVFFDYSPLTPFFSTFLHRSAGQNNELYETTIF